MTESFSTFQAFQKYFFKQLAEIIENQNPDNTLTGGLQFFLEKIATYEKKVG